MKVKIIVDSCSDIPSEVMKSYDIDMVPLNITINDRVMLDRVELTPPSYYRIIEQVGLPITSSPNLAQWKRSFDAALKDNNYDKLVAITISSKMSNTYESAVIAARKFYSERIKVFDSTLASAGEGLIALKMRELLDKNYDFETVYSFMEKLRKEVIQIGFMNTLKMLVKTGRVTKAQNFFASLIRLKPMIMTVEGENKPLSNAISLKSAAKKAIKEILKRIDPSLSYTMLITHAEGKEIAASLQDEIEARISISKSFINYMGPVVGSRVGLGAQLIALIPDKEP